jgi:hypothetical protein
MNPLVSVDWVQAKLISWSHVLCERSTTQDMSSRQPQPLYSSFFDEICEHSVCDSQYQHHNPTKHESHQRGYGKKSTLLSFAHPDLLD